MNARKKAQKSVPTAHGTAAEQKTNEIDAFVVSASSSLSELRPLVLKHGNAFGVFDTKGDALASPGGTQGVYYCDTRHLSHFSITLNDCRIMLLSSTLRDDNTTLTCDLANPGMFDDDGRVVVEHDLIHIRRTRFLWKAGCFERLCIRNFDDQVRSLRLGIVFAADFADLFEVRGMVREKRGQLHEPEIRYGQATLSYTGLDDRRRSTTLRFDPVPEAFTVNQAVFNLKLAPKETRSIFVEIDCRQGDSPLRPVRAYFTSLRDAWRELLAKSSRAVSIASSNDTFNESARRATADLYMLMTELPEGLYPYAGIPWYSTVFGRDGLITAMMMLWVDPTVARGVLSHLAATQATEIDPAADAEPGKILHEARHGEMAVLCEVPFRRYYGSVDATPLFVMLAGEYLDRTDDVETCRRLWPNIEAALGWIETYGDGGLFRAWSTRVGRTVTTRFSTRTGRWPEGRSRSLKSRPMSSPPGGPPSASCADSGSLTARLDTGRRRRRSVSASTRCSSTRSSVPMSSRSTATRSPAASAHPTRATRSSLASRYPNGRVLWRRP